MWSETYEREVKDVFAIQDEISRAIVEKLRVELTGAARSLIRRHTENLEAYSLYLKGRYWWNKRTEQALLEGIRYFERAIAEDPNYAPAHAGLADSYGLLGQYGMIAPREAMPKGKTAASRALEIDPSLPDPHATLGLIGSLYDWEWATAEHHYHRSLDLNPGFVTAHHWYAIDHLAPLGRLDEAFEEIRIAQKLDPLSPIINTNLGDILFMQGRHAQAMEQYRQTLELDPNFYRTHWELGWVHEEEHRFAEAEAEFRKAEALLAGAPLIAGDLGYCYALWGKKAEAHKVLAQVLALAKTRYVSSVNVALIHFGLGETDHGFEWLEKACQERDARLVWLKEFPIYAALHRDPRFIAIMKQIGLD